jgi:hypothetical protein
MDALRDFATVLSASPVQFESVILHRQLSLAVLQSYPPLIKFLNMPSTTTAITNYLFNITWLSRPQFHEIAKNIVHLIITGGPDIFGVICGSRIFTNAMHSFLKSDSSKSCRLCGNLSSVLFHTLRLGCSDVFKRFPDMPLLLLGRLDYISIELLLAEIAVFDSALLLDSEIILKLSEMAMGQSVEAISTIIRIWNAISDDSVLFSHFMSPKVISNLFNLVLSETNSRIINDIMAIIAHLHEFGADLGELFDQYTDRLGLRAGNITMLSISALFFTSPDVQQIFSLYFEPDAHRQLHEYCQCLVQMLDPDTMIVVLEIPDFVERLVGAYGTDRWCPHMTDLAYALSRVQFDNEIWKSFVSGTFRDVIRTLVQPYGGDLPGPAAKIDRYTSECLLAQKDGEDEDIDVDFDSDSSSVTDSDDGFDFGQGSDGDCE